MNKKQLSVAIATWAMFGMTTMVCGQAENTNIQVEQQIHRQDTTNKNNIKKEDFEVKPMTTTLKGKEVKRSDFISEEKTLNNDGKKHISLNRGGSVWMYSYTESDITLLAKLIQSEALDEPYEGKLAVGNVVLKKVQRSRLTLEKVIYARGQFNGVNTKLFNQNPSDDCIKASREVLNGRIAVDATNFVDLRNANPSWTKEFRFIGKIGNHWFYSSEK